MLQWFMYQGADAMVLGLSSDLLLHFIFWGGVNKFSGHVITPPWNALPFWYWFLCGKVNFLM